jgi:hypothetical protein
MLLVKPSASLYQIGQTGYYALSSPMTKSCFLVWQTGTQIHKHIHDLLMSLGSFVQELLIPVTCVDALVASQRMLVSYFTQHQLLSLERFTQLCHDQYGIILRPE